MKRFSLLLTSLILLCGWVGAQNDKISFNETEHDFGTIGEKNGNVTFDFVLTNNSNETIVITNAVASCGCTRPIWTKEPIEPGKQGTIAVTYNPLGRVSPFNKPVTVYFNNQSNPVTLKIKGTVVKGDVAKKKPEDDYPVALGSYLLKSKELNFDRVNLKEAKTIRLEVFNNSDNPVTQKTVKLPKYLTVAFTPVTIPAKSAGVVDVTLNVQENNIYGDLTGDFTLLINDARQSFPYSAIVLDNFSQWTATQKTSAGKININGAEINFGNLSSGSSRTLRIANSGKSALNIHAIQSSDPAVTVSKSRLVINPGEIADVKINIDTKKIPANLSSKLSVISDDPNTPIYEMSVLATNKKP